MHRCAILATLVALSVSSAQAPIAFRSVAVGGDFSCGIDASGQAYCWGAINRSLIPKALDTPARFTQIAAAQSHACGVSEDEAVWCWGSGPDGQLGAVLDSAQGGTVQQLVPSGARQVAVGDKFLLRPRHSRLRLLLGCRNQ